MAAAISNGHISGNGPFTESAERLITRITSADKTLLTTNCTHALELAARILDLGPNDEVIVPAYTFVSTASAIALTGARPVFVDVTPKTLTLDLERVQEAITNRTKAVFTVHYAGVGDRVDELSELCARAGVSLVEDNAHGLGATFDGRKLGTFGSMSTLTFHETKNVSCGEGGALTLNSNEFLDYAEILREKGTDRARFLRGQIDKYTWTAVGSSWVASDILAAYLVGQLEKFDAIQRRRRKIWDMYDRELHGWAMTKGLRSPTIPDKSEHSAHLYYLHLQNAAERSRFILHMRKLGVMAVFHYQALNNSPMGQRLGGKPGQCPIAEDASNTLVRIPLFGDLTDSEVDQVITAVTAFE